LVLLVLVMLLLLLFVLESGGREALPVGQVAAAIHSDLFTVAAAAVAAVADVWTRMGLAISEPVRDLPAAGTAGTAGGVNASAGAANARIEHAADGLTAGERFDWRRFGWMAMGTEGFKMRDGGFGEAPEWAASHSFAAMLTFCPLNMLV
jgi:hypothetical protein